MTTEQVAKGIESYSFEQSVIRRILSRYGELSEKEFDRVFPNDFKSNRCHFITSETIMMSGRTRWERYLEIMQYMAFAGIVKAERHDDGLVYYSLIPQS